MSTTYKKNAYCFTVNNPTPEDEEKLKKLEKDSRVRYFVIGHETGEEGTPHYQGYIYFKSRVVFDTVKKLLPRAHIEESRGSVDEASDYCKKDGDFYEFGDKPMNQKRKGECGKEYWENNLNLAKKGRVEECDAKLQITHHHALYSIASRHAPMPPDNIAIDNHWYYGPTGTGKSHKARTENPGLYLKMCNKWWDGYQGEDTVLIEDFDKVHKVLGYHMKIWCDKYAFPAEVKGSKTNLRPKRIIVTSNWSPQEIWSDEPQTLQPILRRFKLTHFNGSINDLL